MVGQGTAQARLAASGLPGMTAWRESATSSGPLRQTRGSGLNRLSGPAIAPDRFTRPMLTSIARQLKILSTPEAPKDGSAPHAAQLDAIARWLSWRAVGPKRSPLNNRLPRTDRCSDPINILPQERADTHRIQNCKRKIRNHPPRARKKHLG